MISSGFAANTAAKTGATARTIQHEVQIANALADDVRKKLHGTPMADCKSELLRLARLPVEVQRQVAGKLEADTSIKLVEALRQIKRDDLASGVTPLPSGKYRVILADPPWRYSDNRAGLEGFSRTAAEDQYPTMSVADLCALDVRSLADDDAVLFCWATFPLLQDALEVVRAWGFGYKTAFVWSKVRPNFGHYHTANAELLLVCTRGHCTPDVDNRESQVQVITRTGRHSAKPEAFRALIDRLYPHGRRIELFRRGNVPNGWAVWGNETTRLDDDRDAIA